MLPKEIFLSHSSTYRVIATEIAEKIRKNSIPVWFSQTNIIGAQQWHEEIGKALRRCDWFIVLLSNDSVHSTWVKREMLYALTHKQYENHILPIYIEDCDAEELSWTINLIEYIDMKNICKDSFTNLFRTWGIGYSE